ncbi:hypothetical protein V6N11_043550 [Hibiscus sabdariffa]|uniref:Granulins domain-containing protein n=1 Tax=Hibiscus sabdariffa TaxID=183260 RepID=A0ABR2RCK5_9ROSI
MLLLSATVPVPASPEQDACFKICVASCKSGDIGCTLSYTQCCYEDPEHCSIVTRNSERFSHIPHHLEDYMWTA